MKRQRTKSNVVATLPRRTDRYGVSPFKEEYVRQVFFLCLLGATDMMIAEAFDVSINTIDNWKRSKDEFLRAMKEGKIEADAKMAASLYKAGVGYEYEEQTVIANRIKRYGADGKVIEEVTEPLVVGVKKVAQPNVKAAIKWLSARQPGVWGDKVKVQGKLEIAHSIDLKSLSTDELMVLKKLGGNVPVDTEFEEA